MNLRNRIHTLLSKVTSTDKVEIFIPENESHGHYSTNVAFALGKIWSMSPIEAAQKIKEEIILADKGGLFRKIDVVNPGFINFWISDRALHTELKEILAKKQKYGKPKIKKSDFLRKIGPRRIQLEFISANPTGPLTMANGRGGFLGDVLANVLEFSGRKIEREYYVNDTGNQIITLGKSLTASLNLIADEEKFYKGDYIKKWALKNRALIKKSQESPLLIGQRAAKDFLAAVQKVIKQKARIHFDRYTSENKDIYAKNFVKKALAIFKKKKLTYEKDGALWLKTKDFGDDKDRVLITGDGFPTYFLADSGHLLETKSKGFDEKILILGPDHYGYVTRIKAAATVLGFTKPLVLVTQAVRVVKNGQEIKMSKRQGEFLTLEEVVDEVGQDAARFFFLMHSPESHMDFDLKLAKERSLKNPVYYVQYAFVRASAILKRATSNHGLRTSNKKVRSSQFAVHGSASAKLLRELIRFPEVVEDVACDYQVHRLTRYVTELSHAFHNFYEKERVVGEKDKNLATTRLQLVRATQIILKNTLYLLGVSEPKKM